MKSGKALKDVSFYMWSRIKKILILLFFLTLAIPFCPLKAETDLQADQNRIGSFSDIDGHWAEQVIKEWAARDFVGGYPDGTFRPDGLITRAEFFALVNRTFGYPEAGGSVTPYRDVLASDWFAGETAKAIYVGYLGGYPDGLVKPQNPISRQETAVILSRILPLADCEAPFAQFADSTEIPDSSKTAIDAAICNGYMSGYPDGSFRPGRAITRAEAISVLNRAAGALYNTAGTFGPHEGTMVLEGNVTISAADVVLQNMIITGNLYLTEGIGSGDVTLSNVQVQGTTKVSGGGEDSIHLINTGVRRIVVNVPSRNLVRLCAQGTSAVEVLEAITPARLEEADLSGTGFNDLFINLQAGLTIQLAGSFRQVVINDEAVVDLQRGRIAEVSFTDQTAGAVLQLAAGTTVEKLIDNAEETVIKGQGQIIKSEINAENISIELEKAKDHKKKYLYYYL